MLKVNRNVPKPDPIRRSATRRKYPFDDLEVGDNFFVPNRSTNTLSTHVSTVGKQLGRVFSTRLCWMRQTKNGWRVCGEDAEGAVCGIGVWRDA